MPRAGRPVKTLVTMVSSASALFSAWVNGGDHGFRAEEIGGADLHRRSTQRETCHDPTGIADAASRDHRDLDRVRDLGIRAKVPTCRAAVRAGHRTGKFHDGRRPHSPWR